MAGDGSIYDELGVRTVINAVGTRTQISGTLMREEAREAMRRASEEFVYIPELQARASELISEVTGAEAGFVPTGAAAGLALGSAACIAGDDFSIMERLPDTEGVPSEIVIPRAHQCKYVTAFGATGAELVPAGIVSHHPVDGGTDKVEPWQLDAAITEETVAVAYVQKRHRRLPLSMVTEVAHENGVPVIVDAASELPPRSNLSRFFEEGADLVSFSGGKAVRGPQSTGILAGRRDLVGSAAMQALPDGYNYDLWDPPEAYVDKEDLPGTPPMGVGRGMKVGKEELVGLIAALEAFVEEDDEALAAEDAERSRMIAEGLEESDALSTRLSDPGDPRIAPEVVVSVDEERAGMGTVELIGRLREEDPRVWLNENRVPVGEIPISPVSLSDEDAEYLVERIRAHAG